jgi:hypothetical protein
LCNLRLQLLLTLFLLLLLGTGFEGLFDVGRELVVVQKDDIWINLFNLSEEKTRNQDKRLPLGFLRQGTAPERP